MRALCSPCFFPLNPGHHRPTRLVGPASGPLGPVESLEHRRFAGRFAGRAAPTPGGSGLCTAGAAAASLALADRLEYFGLRPSLGSSG